MAYYLQDISVKELREILMSKTRTVIVPVGVVEQHGYHLPLGVDIYNTQMLLELGKDQIDAVIAPTVPYCFSGGELTGTLNVSPQVFSLFLSDITVELAKTGFQNIVVLLGHAGTDNAMALKNCLQMILRRNKELDIPLSYVAVWDLSPTWLANFSMRPQADFHAGRVETSLMKFWKPELVKETVEMDAEPIASMMRTDQDWFELREKKIDHPFIVERVSQKPEIQVGVMGYPEEATSQLGEQIYREMIAGLKEYVDLLNSHTEL